MFTEALTPDFNSPEAQAAVEAFPSGKDCSPLSQARFSLKENAEIHNHPSPSSDMRPFAERVLSPLKPESVRTVSSSLISTALGTGVLSPFALSLHVASVRVVHENLLTRSRYVICLAERSEK